MRACAHGGLTQTGGADGGHGADARFFFFWGVLDGLFFFLLLLLLYRMYACVYGDWIGAALSRSE